MDLMDYTFLPKKSQQQALPPPPVEPTTLANIHHTLTNCHFYRTNLYLTIWRWIFGIFFISFVGAVFYFAYTQKQLDVVNNQKVMDDEYLQAKQAAMEAINTNFNISGLPIVHRI